MVELAPNDALLASSTFEELAHKRFENTSEEDVIQELLLIPNNDSYVKLPSHFQTVHKLQNQYHPDYNSTSKFSPTERNVVNLIVCLELLLWLR